MKSPTRIARPLVVAGLALALTATGCATNSGNHAGAAATVGKVRITESDLKARVDAALADPTTAQSLGAQRADFERQVLTRMIEDAVVEAAAKQENVTVSDQQVSAKQASFAQQAGGETQLEQQALQQAGIAKPYLTEAIRSIALREALSDKLVAGQTVPDATLRQAYQQNIAQYDQVHAAHILVKDKATADKILAQLKTDPSKFAALAKQYSIDTSNSTKGGDLGFAGKGQFVKPFEDAIFAAKPGSIIGPVKTQFGYHVIHVIEHKITTFEQAKASLTAQALDSEKQTKLGTLINDVINRLGISVSPRYGTWDATQAKVVAAPDTVSSTEGPTGQPSGTPAPTP